MDMEKAMMARFHAEMYMLHNQAAALNQNMQQIHMQMAQSNYNLYMHQLGGTGGMMHQMPGMALQQMLPGMMGTQQMPGMSNHNMMMPGTMCPMMQQMTEMQEHPMDMMNMHEHMHEHDHEH